MLTDQKNKSTPKGPARSRISVSTITALLLGVQFGCKDIDTKKLLRKNLKHHIQSAQALPNKGIGIVPNSLYPIEVTKDGGDNERGSNGSRGIPTDLTLHPQPTVLPGAGSPPNNPSNSESRIPMSQDSLPATTILPGAGSLPNNPIKLESGISISQASLPAPTTLLETGYPPNNPSNSESGIPMSQAPLPAPTTLTGSGSSLNNPIKPESEILRSPLPVYPTVPPEDMQKREVGRLKKSELAPVAHTPSNALKSSNHSFLGSGETPPPRDESTQNSVQQQNCDPTENQPNLLIRLLSKRKQENKETDSLSRESKKKSKKKSKKQKRSQKQQQNCNPTNKAKIRNPLRIFFKEQ